MNAFAAALASLMADPNLGTEATYVGPTGGPGQAVRILLSELDEVQALITPGAVVPQVVVRLPVASLPDLAVGGTFLVGLEGYVVTSLARGSQGLAWRLACRRLADGLPARSRLQQAAT